MDAKEHSDSISDNELDSRPLLSSPNPSPDREGPGSADSIGRELELLRETGECHLNRCRDTWTSRLVGLRSAACDIAVPRADSSFLLADDRGDRRAATRERVAAMEQEMTSRMAREMQEISGEVERMLAAYTRNRLAGTGGDGTESGQSVVTHPDDTDRAGSRKLLDTYIADMNTVLNRIYNDGRSGCADDVKTSTHPLSNINYPSKHSSDIKSRDSKSGLSTKRCKTAGKTFGRTSKKSENDFLPPLALRNPYTIPAYLDNRKVLFKTQKLKKSRPKSSSNRRKIIRNKSIYNPDVFHNEVIANADVFDEQNQEGNELSTVLDSDVSIFLSTMNYSYKIPKPPQNPSSRTPTSRGRLTSCSLGERRGSPKISEEEIIDRTLFEFSDD